MLLSWAARQRSRRPYVFAGCTGIMLARSTSSFSLQFNALVERSFSSEIRASVSGYIWLDLVDEFNTALRWEANAFSRAALGGDIFLLSMLEDFVLPSVLKPLLMWVEMHSHHCQTPSPLCSPNLPPTGDACSWTPTRRSSSWWTDTAWWAFPHPYPRCTRARRMRMGSCTWCTPLRRLSECNLLSKTRKRLLA